MTLRIPTSQTSSIPKAIMVDAIRQAKAAAPTPVRRGRRSLRNQLMLLVALLLGTVALALLMFLPERIESRSRRLVDGRAVGIATLLAKATGPALEFDDESSALERLSQMASTPDAMYATVLHADGRSLATWRAPTAANVQVASAAKEGVTIEASVLHVVVPILTKAGTKGSLVAGFTLEELDRARQAAFRLVAIASAIVFVFGLVIAFVIGTLLVRPITKMTDIALRISAGDAVDAAATSIARVRDDEVGTMARAFESMLGTLDRHRTFLECQSEASGDGILIVSDRLEIISHNRRLLEIWGLTRGITATDAKELLVELAPLTLDPKGFAARVTEIEGKPDAVFTDEIWLADGRVCERHTAPITSADGTHFGRGWYFREITDRKRAEKEIRALNTDLERRVDERTQALELANKELAARFAQLHETQRALIEASRKSGMADMATAVLHDVGNVLNSVNVSANLVADHYRTSRINDLGKAVDLLTANQHRLGELFTTDPRGPKLHAFLAALVGVIGKERELVTSELSSLQKNIDHIKVIVSRQQTSAKQGGVEESVTLEDLLDDAIDSTATSFAAAGIVVTRELEPTQPITCDRHKAYQIVMNFLTNAKDALQGNGPGTRSVTVRTRMHDDNHVILEVCDNGIGIAAEHLDRIFSHGFTTKPQGHGFGLHSSACCAAEMGGTVAVESRGVGHGSLFRLTMPVTRVLDTSALRSNREAERAVG
jgi:signal transduction histidine kinase/HAMP domain-containing protein